MRGRALKQFALDFEFPIRVCHGCRKGRKVGRRARMSSLGLETGSSTGRGEEGEGGYRQIWNSFVIFRFLLYSRGGGRL